MTSITVESWIWYGVVILMVAIRLYESEKLPGVQKTKVADLLIIQHRKALAFQINSATSGRGLDDAIPDRR